MKVAAAHVKAGSTLLLDGREVYADRVNPDWMGAGVRGPVIRLLNRRRGTAIPGDLLRTPHHTPDDLNIWSGWRFFDTAELLEVQQ